MVIAEYAGLDGLALTELVKNKLTTRGRMQ
jgi:hypothetical protein